MTTDIRVGWRGLIALVLFALVFGLLIAAGQVGDLLIRAAIWAVILTTSALLLLQRFRRSRARLASKPDAILKRWHRWAMDETDHR
jgi:hypothetical protein